MLITRTVSGTTPTDTNTSHRSSYVRRATRHRVLFTAATGTHRLTTRGQHRRHGDAVQNDHSLPRHDDRIKEAHALARRHRHHHITQVHSLGGEHLGRQPQPGARPKRMAAKPSDFQLPTSGVGTPLDWPVHFDGKRSPPPFQRQMARPQVRGRRLSTPTGRRVSTRGQLLQPPMGRSTLPMCKPTPIGRSSYGHRALLTPQTLVSKATQHGHRDNHYLDSRVQFSSGRHGSREGVGRPRWSVVAFRLPRRLGYTPAEAL
jgi:hypothetical protein